MQAKPSHGTGSYSTLGSTIKSNDTGGFDTPVGNRVPYQYALPIHNSSPHGNIRSSGNSDGVQRQSDHTNTLRRKTPNGTLNEGYDGTDDLNPMKHQLLLARYGPTAQAHQSHPVGERRTFLQRQSSTGSARWNQHASNVGWPNVSGQQQTQNGYPQLDSMLHQMPMPMQQYNQQQYYGQTVPSVLQPSFQQLGPTASGVQGSGPYGPYWHDGTFVPYRPTAVRDPRFYNQPGPGWHHLLSPAHFNATNWQAALSPGAGLYPDHYFSNTNPFAPFANRGPARNNQHNNVYGDAAQTGRGVIAGSHGYYQDASNFMSAQTGQPGPEVNTSGDAATLKQDIAADFGPSSPNGQQRDKTFAWALQQYRDLLLFIHNTRKQHEHQQSRHVHGVPIRPTFFPKPPRPAASTSRTSSFKRSASLGSPSKSSLPEVSGGTADGASGASDHSTHDGGVEASKSRSSSVWSPSGVQFHDSDYQRRASYQQQQQQQSQWINGATQPDAKFRTLRRSSGSSISPIVSPLPQDDSPPSRAHIALAYMETLCREADWQWTDGMHLGGCLAYGLGNYHKALRWQTKVLENDPRYVSQQLQLNIECITNFSRHLEGTSNIAATLLALGRRQEAEQNWMKVVRVAPNHFEAVEHLVGLLCHDQRNRNDDAIKVIEYVEKCLHQQKSSDLLKVSDRQSDCSSSTASRSPCISELSNSEKICYDFDADNDGLGEQRDALSPPEPRSLDPGFGSSGFAIPGSENGRILALIHAKGNMLYGRGDNSGAAKAFETAVLIAAGRKFNSIQALVKHILTVVPPTQLVLPHSRAPESSGEPILLSPEQALTTARLCFPNDGELPGLRYVPGGLQSLQRKAMIATTSNSLLSLAKIFQDGMSNNTRSPGVTQLASGVKDILALYYLSLSLQPSPSTANNVGILLASVQQAAPIVQPQHRPEIPGVVPGSGIALALQYYNYGLQLDQHHAHLYTNLGSLLKDIGQLDAAINMYERAVSCDGKFDIALANLANAVKDKGRINDAIKFYKRAVDVSPDFAEAVCGLVNALNSVCSWGGRGGIAEGGGTRDRWHVALDGMLLDARVPGAASSGWLKRVVDIVEKQLVDGEGWGRGTLSSAVLEDMVQQMTILDGPADDVREREQQLRSTLTDWAGKKWEGARLTRLVERATRRIGWHWYQDKYVRKKQRTSSSYDRPQLPATLTVPSAPTVLPFHTFTCPMSAKQIRLISQRNGLRISVSTLRAPWLPKHVYPPPPPPSPYFHVGYVSSDFNNHPLAHLMQSVFGFHDTKRVKAYCYATTQSDGSVHRRQIEEEAPVFRDASSWSAEKLVKQIVQDGIHILVNLNGYTRGARNEVFAARPAPIQMSFMGFAGTLGAEWCDYLLADDTAIPPDTLRPWRRNVDLEDQMVDDNNGSEQDDWVYGENIIYCRDTFFCCDHRQSALDAREKRMSWDEEQRRRWQMRKELFPTLPDTTIIFGNFNQLYKVRTLQ